MFGHTSFQRAWERCRYCTNSFNRRTSAFDVSRYMLYSSCSNKPCGGGTREVPVSNSDEQASDARMYMIDSTKSISAHL